jgi:predicted AAA+ superfamily ATPase
MQIVERAIFPALKETLDDHRVIVITGMRRVGKTTSLRWLLDQVPSQNKIYLDLERLDQRAVFHEENYDLVVEYLRNLGMDINQPMTVALDEIQYEPNLPSVVKYLYDHYSIKFLLTGSSSYYLKNYFSESLAGRKMVYELFPLRFGEFLDFKGIPYRKRSTLEEMRFDVHEFERLKGFYDEFIAFGGLPDVVLENRVDRKREILNDIFDSYIRIDVSTLADFRKMDELQKLLKVLALRIGNKLDYSKLSQVVGITRPTLNEYLKFLEQTYVIKRLSAFSGADRAVALGNKLYFHDNGIASVLGQPSEGAFFENAIFNQLKHYGELAYLAKGNDYEIDFILTQPDGSPVALEAKYHPVIADVQKVKQIAQRKGIENSWVIGRYPTPECHDFLWGGLVF